MIIMLIIAITIIIINNNYHKVRSLWMHLNALASAEHSYRYRLFYDYLYNILSMIIWLDICCRNHSLVNAQSFR